MTNYFTISQDGIFEEDIKKSRFICQLKRVENEEEARSFIAQIKKEHYKANHSCSAMIIGKKSEIKRSSDDGEPSGTAGIPMLNVLEKKKLTNVVAVVTRYFGGIKLGAGGLVRAYSGAVAHAVAAIGMVEVKSQEVLEIQLTYPQYQILAQFLASQDLPERNTDFSDKVITQVYLDKKRVATFVYSLTDYYQGKVSTKILGQQIVEVAVHDKIS